MLLVNLKILIPGILKFFFRQSIILTIGTWLRIIPSYGGWSPPEVAVNIQVDSYSEFVTNSLQHGNNYFNVNLFEFFSPPETFFFNVNLSFFFHHCKILPFFLM